VVSLNIYCESVQIVAPRLCNNEPMCDELGMRGPLHSERRHGGAVWIVGVLAASVACSSSDPAASQPTSDPESPDASPADASTGDAAPPPFQAEPPSVYVAKVKNVLVGLPPTQGEVNQVEADPAQLKTLIGGWMQLPAYQQKMIRFFELAFQQTQISTQDFADQAYPRQIGFNNSTIPLLIQNTQESFPRTMLQLTADGHPFREATTTRQLMMTTALKELYAFLDIWEVDDNGRVTDRFRQANPGLAITVGAAQGPIPMSETLDPASPNYMHWYDPDVATANAQTAGCASDPIVYPPSGMTLHFLLYGSLDNRRAVGGVACQQFGGTAAAPQLTLDDFNDWKMVTIRAPKEGEAISRFYDLPALRSAGEMILSIPRVGFQSTPAFFANWQTNISNQMRVTLNQTLVVALGSSVDGTDTTTTPGTPLPGLDTTHASSGECFYCHQTLDPLRSIFSANYSWNYHNQLDPALTAQKGLFSFRGVIQPVTTIDDFGKALAEHPLFAEAWVQKLCYYVNSSPCLASDPEFQRIVGLFRSSNYGWNTLVTELLSSPLTTSAARTQTVADGGEVIAVSRRDHLCAALDNRLGFTDVCGLNVVKRRQQQALIPSIATGLPSDGYGRGSTAPVLPNEPTLLYRAGTENICAAVATQVIDVPEMKQVPNVKQWSSAQPDAAIADFVTTIMALVSSDPRSAPATALLKAHFSTAVEQGATPSDALKSTFVAACLAPSSVSIGF